jgi:hypothetical protein
MGAAVATQAVDLRVLAAAVARELGPAWDIDPEYEATITTGDMRISFCLGGGRVDIRGGFSDYKAQYDTMSYNERPPMIGVSATKSAKLIAADIRRRLLSDTEALVARCRAHVAAQTAHRTGVAETAQHVASALGLAPKAPRVVGTAQPDLDRARVTVPFDNDDHTFEVKINGADRVSLSGIPDLTAAEAIAVCELLAKLGKARG